MNALLEYIMNNLPQLEIKSFDLIGKALICQWDLHEYDMIDHIITVDEIKQRFASEIAQAIIEQKLIEFTKFDDIVTGITSFRARVFVLPDSQVKTIRLEKLI